MARTTTVDLGNELKGFVESLLESGDYQTQSEVIRESVRLLRERHAESKLETLRQLIQEGDESGESRQWNVEEFLVRMKNKHGG